MFRTIMPGGKGRQTGRQEKVWHATQTGHCGQALTRAWLLSKFSRGDHNHNECACPKWCKTGILGAKG